jgi:uncharacterized membrane protein YidH (DUF202 family)
VDVPRLYRAAIALFGFSVTLNALDTLRTGGLALIDAGMALVGAGLVATVLVARDPDRHGYPTGTNVWVYVVVTCSLLAAAGVVVSLLSVVAR